MKITVTPRNELDKDSRSEFGYKMFCELDFMAYGYLCNTPNRNELDLNKMAKDLKLPLASLMYSLAELGDRDWIKLESDK